jgi:hypothetical protein
VGRLRSDHEENAVKAESLHHMPGDLEMPPMNGIECAAKNRDSHDSCSVGSPNWLDGVRGV